MNESKTQIRFFSSGYCWSNIKHVLPNEKSRKIKFYATWAFIQHPILKNIVFDTGYHQRFFSATKGFPNRIYRWITPVFHKDEESCVNTLENLGFSPDDMNHLIISHFHGDHIAGLKDFRNSNIWTSKKGHDFVKSKSNLNGVFKGILKPLIPKYQDEQMHYIETELSQEVHLGLKSYKWAEDVFFIDLPGHCRGQMGLFLKNTNLGDVLLCSDAAWSAEAIQKRIFPAKMTALIFDSYTQTKKTIEDLHHFSNKNKNVRILTTHGSETFKLIGN